jgi:hypothetical protein
MRAGTTTTLEKFSGTSVKNLDNRETRILLHAVSSRGVNVVIGLQFRSSMNVQHIFRWDGEPVGYIAGGQLYDYRGSHVGWLEDDRTMWRADGGYLGELVDGEYILRNIMVAPPLKRSPQRGTGAAPEVQPPARRMPRPPREGWTDAI